MPVASWSTTSLLVSVDTPVWVTASEFKLKSLRHSYGFFRAGFDVRAQVLKSDGAIGIWLEARPAAKVYRFISAWRNESAQWAMVKANPHREIMVHYRPLIEWSRLASWAVEAAALPMSWEFAEAQFARK